MINKDTVWVVSLHEYIYDFNVEIDDYETRTETRIVGIFLTEEEARETKKKLDKIYADDDVHETVCDEWPIGRIIDEEIRQDISEFEVYGVL